MHRILAVDDEIEILNILKEFLTKKGFEVIAMLSGEKAMEVLDSGVKIDLMILDMRMPKIKGVDILTKVKITNRVIPAILLTGSIDPHTYMAKLEESGYGLNDILFKPIDLNILLGLVKKKLNL